MGKTNRTTSIALITVIGITLPALGLAGVPSQTEKVSVKVSYADLDIHSSAGAKVLYARLRRASEEVCVSRGYMTTRSLTETSKAKACVREALEASVEKIDSDALEEIHAG